MINLNLEIAEIEAILNHLGRAAYADVAGLIAKLHGQAVPQVQAIKAKAEEDAAKAEAEKPTE